MYTVTQFGVSGVPEPIGLNDKGDVAGIDFSGGAATGAIWYANGSTLLLPAPWHGQSALYNIDNEGTAVGGAIQPERAIVVRNTMPADVAATAPATTLEFAPTTCINSPVGKPHLICFTNGQGEVVAVDSATLSVAFTISTPNVQLQAVTINDNSDVAGWCGDSAADVSFFFRGGVVTKFPGNIVKLNNSGQACGTVGPGPLPVIWDMTGPVPVVSKLVQLVAGLR